MTRKFYRQSFTLIELLIALVVIGIISTIVLSKYENIVKKSRAPEAYNFMGQMRKAQEIYRMETGDYADDISDLDTDLPPAEARNWLYSMDTDTGIDDPAGFKYNDYIIVAHPNANKPQMANIYDHPHIHSDNKIGVWKSASEPHSHGDYSHTHDINHGNVY